MRVELLVVPDCPSEAPTHEHLRQVLDEAGRDDTPITVRTVTEGTLCSLPMFAGSPTVVIDGVDPFAGQASPGAGMSCRIYQSAAGMSGVPSLEDLRRAVASLNAV